MTECPFKEGDFVKVRETIALTTGEWIQEGWKGVITNVNVIETHGYSGTKDRWTHLGIKFPEGDYSICWTLRPDSLAHDGRAPLPTGRRKMKF